MALSPTSSHGSGSGSGIGATLFDSTLGGAAATIDTGAAGIAAGYRMIRVLITVRTDQASVAPAFNVTVNNDSSAIYDKMVTTSTGAGVVSCGVVLAGTSWQPTGAGASNDAGVAATFELTFHAYDQTTFHKVGTGTGGVTGNSGANSFQNILELHYRATTAISRLAITTTAGSFIAGSRLTVLGF